MEYHKHTGIDQPRIDPKDLLGFPIFNQIPTHKAEEGTIVLVRDGTDYSLYVKIDKTWISIGSTSTDASGNVLIDGKLTVTGVIDPTAVILADAGNAAYFQSGPGQLAVVSPLGTGRIRYNASTNTWQVSGNGGSYADLATGGSAFITAIADTATINLTVTGSTLSADFVSMNVSQFTNDAGYSTGGVTSVSGTVNRITSSGGATPVIDIAATYVGQSSITTLGTIGTGIWQGTPIANAFIANAAVANLSGTNTGDQTSIVGITGTKAQFDTAVTDGNFLYTGDITQYTDEMAQDAVGSMVNTSLTYTDGGPTLGLTSRTIGGVSFDGTANITVASATGGFTISGGNLALGTNSITMTGSIGVTGARVLKGWFTDLEVTNPIAGSITGNAGTVTTIPNLTGDVTSVGNTTTIPAATVTLAMMADIATNRILGRSSAGTGVPQAMNGTQATTILNVFVGDSGAGGSKGLVIAPAIGDATKFLRGDATWSAPTASVSITETEIDVGTTPVAEASIAVTNAGVTASSKIIGGVAYKAPTGKDLDELEMDALEVKFEPASGSLNVHLKGLEGYIADKFIIWYTFA